MQFIDVSSALPDLKLPLKTRPEYVSGRKGLPGRNDPPSPARIGSGTPNIVVRLDGFYSVLVEV